MKLFLLFFGLISFCPTFAQMEEEVELKTNNCILKGTLNSAGKSENPQTLVILIAGSGPTDRNGNNAMMTNNSLKMFSEMLVERGYACLRYDKRAIGESIVENFDQKKSSFDDFISDAEAWVNKYNGDSRFNKIVLAGHSQGSLVAMCTANRSGNVDAIISIAGPGQPIHEVLKKQLAATLTIEMQGLVNSKLDTLAMGDTLLDTPDILHNLMHPIIQPFLISWMKYDPASEIKKLKIPLLLINGTKDIQIAVSEMEMLKAANPMAISVKIKNMNHVLKTIKTMDMGLQLELYAEPDAPLHKKLAKPIVKFLESIR